MKSSEILLLLNGELRSPAQVRAAARRGAAVVCADGGARHAASLGLAPDVIIGDMDSLPRRLPRWKRTLFICDFDPDVSDFEKAIRFIGRRRFTRAARRVLGPGSAAGPAVWVAGLSGGRADQELVNWAIFERYARQLRLVAAEGGSAEIAGPGRHPIRCRKGQAVTLLSVTPKAKVSTHGLHYALRRGVLERGSRGLSNRAISSAPSVTVHSGRIWIIVP